MISALLALFALQGQAPEVSTDGVNHSWQPLAPIRVQRMESGTARIGDFVYVVGGLTAPDTFRATRLVEVYDIQRDQWSFVTSAPLRLHHVPAAAWETNLYVVGGWTGFHDARRRTFIYDTLNDAWSQGQLMPQKRAGHAMVAYQGKLYVFGGVDDYDNPQRSTFIYDIQADQWTQGLDMFTPRDHVSAVLVGDFIYVLGGRVWGNNRAANERFDPATGQWASMAPMPTPRSATVTAAVGNKIYVAGGELPDLHDEVEVYDATTNTWETQDPMPIPRHGTQAVTLGNRILIPGGAPIFGLGPSRHVDQFVPERSPANARPAGEGATR